MVVNLFNSSVEVARLVLAFHTTTNTAKGLSNVLYSDRRTNGTIKMLLGGAGNIKITKYGKILLGEMQRHNPTTHRFQRSHCSLNSVQDDTCGDGPTSAEVLIGGLLKKAEKLLIEGLHPHIRFHGFDQPKAELTTWIA